MSSLCDAWWVPITPSAAGMCWGRRCLRRVGPASENVGLLPDSGWRALGLAACEVLYLSQMHDALRKCAMGELRLAAATMQRTSSWTGNLA